MLWVRTAPRLQGLEATPGRAIMRGRRFDPAGSRSAIGGVSATRQAKRKRATTMAQRQSRMLPLGTAAPHFALPDTVSGRTVALEDFASSPALLVAFICNHCPFVKHILDGFVAFARDFTPRGLAVVAISSNDVAGYPADAPAEMKRVARVKGFGFPYLYDESQEVASAYQAVCTPDFFLFDRERRLLHRRQFDRSPPGDGVAVTGSDLRAAVEALLRGGAGPAGATPRLGRCHQRKGDPER